ncbi:Vacuolar protein sorting-associated protein 2-like protein 3 [Forsythia ovata]|uniref:Vacuolar protein sorting-associated protein 2-like protein 3 n=1 Tax=Forsythia ovata TaxID=205694 RepID=A0ABD1X4L2_9LAMI
MNFFSKKPTPKEALRESKREMANATRGIEREINALQLEEKKLVTEIKRTAKTGNEAATKILARQLVRLRQQIANLQGSRAQMRGIATHTQAISAQSSVAVGMKGASKAMASMNKVLDEIGVDIASQLSAAPKGKIAGKNTEDVGSSGIDELEKRLAALRNP